MTLAGCLSYAGVLLRAFVPFRRDHGAAAQAGPLRGGRGSAAWGAAPPSVRAAPPLPAPQRSGQRQTPFLLSLQTPLTRGRCEQG